MNDATEQIRENPDDSSSYAKIAHESLGDASNLEQFRFQDFCAQSDTITYKRDAEKWAKRFRRGTEFQDADQRHRVLLLKLMMESRNGWRKHFYVDDIAEAIPDLVDEKEDANREAIAEDLERAAEKVRDDEL